MNFLQSVLQQIGLYQHKSCVQISNFSQSMCGNDKIWKDKSLASLLAKKYTLLEYCQGMGFFEYWLSTFTSQELESNLL